MKAMILAAGKGTRVQPITHIIPKPMIPILQKPVMEFLLELLKEHGFKTFPNIFDESYDDIEDNVERFNHIINQVEKLCNKGYDYIRDLYLESFDTILYNQKVLYDTKNNNFDKQFNKLIKDI